MRSKWEEVHLSDVVSILGDGLHGTPIYDPNGDYFFINGNNLLNGKIIYKNDTKRVSKEEYDKYKKNLTDRTILVSINGTLGNVAVYNGENCILGKSACYFNVKTSIDKDFIRYIVSSKRFLDYITRLANGTTIKNVSLKVMREYPFFLPPLAVQQSIAATLSCLDDKIELNNKINSNLEAQAQAIFKSWFLSDEALDWEIGSLSDIAYINPPRPLHKNSVATYLEMSNLPTKGSFPIDWSTREFNGGMKFRNGDTIMARITPCLENGKTAYVNFLNDGEVAFGSTEYIVLSAKQGYPNEMMYFLVRDKEFVDYAVKNMSGSSGRQRVSGDIVGKFEMSIPPKKFVTGYAQFFEQVMQTIHNNSFESRALAAIRDALLPKLMSGEIEVPVTK